MDAAALARDTSLMSFLLSDVVNNSMKNDPKPVKFDHKLILANSAVRFELTADQKSVYTKRPTCLREENLSG